MEKIDIWTCKEMNDEQFDVVQNSFQQRDEILFNIEKNIVRCSEGELPWVVYIILNVGLGIMSSAIYDVIKDGIKNILGSPKMNDRGNVIIKENNKQYIFGRNQIFMQSEEKEMIFKSLDDCFEYMEKETQE